MQTIFKAVVALLSLTSVHSASAQDVLDYVHPNIGTAHSRWFFYTPAALPHGMAKLAPSTNGHYGNRSGWEAVGYDARQNSIEGFVQFHEWQIGGVSIMLRATVRALFLSWSYHQERANLRKLSAKWSKVYST